MQKETLEMKSGSLLILILIFLAACSPAGVTSSKKLKPKYCNDLIEKPLDLKKAGEKKKD
jgi:ABC-type oligopeptide transport system substrate-binding subunit